MKKCLAIFVTIVLIVSACALCACNGDELTLYVPDGAPALSVAKIVGDGKVGNNKITTVVTTGPAVQAKCASGEADIAVLPTNAAVKICASRGDYLLFSINVYGVLYIVGTEHIDSLADLVGHTLHSIGQSNTPQFVFQTVCNAQGVSHNDIDVVYHDDASEIIPQIVAGKVQFALIGEPAVTQLKAKAAEKGISVETLFDLQQLWQSATGSNESGYPQASMIVKKDLLTDRFAAQLMNALKANAQHLSTHCDQLKTLLQGVGSALQLNYTAELIANCNITAIPASEAVQDLNTYLITFPALADLLPLSSDLIYETSN